MLSRRQLLGTASAAAAAAALPVTFAPRAQAQAARSSILGEFEGFERSVGNALKFVNQMMDAYATGSTIRLTQSYSDGGLESTAFTYDNAVLIHAYLAAGDADSLARAKVLGQGLLYAQANNFPAADGRFAQAYFVNTAASGVYITPAAFPFYFYTSSVGDQCWAGMALAQLYKRTGASQFLAGAVAVANWIVVNHYDTLGPGGFRWGTAINQYNQSVPSTNGKSTEHNIDCFGFFTMLHHLTHGGSATGGMTWAELAEHALQFLQVMYNPSGPFFYVGTQGDQITINTAPTPEDCQTWSYLALLNNSYKHTIDWALGHLRATDTATSPNSQLTGSETITGLVFDTASLTTTLPGADPSAVWLEGTAHTACALIARILRGSDSFAAILSDIESVGKLLSNCVLAQSNLGAGQTVGGAAIPLGRGLVAATSTMDTGFGYTYGQSLHIGATGWYLLAGFAANPYQLGYRIVG